MIDWDQRPLQTIMELKKFRDTIAHGKPIEVDYKYTTEVKPDIHDAAQGEWQEAVTSDFIGMCEEDIDAFWQTMLTASQINPTEMLTRAQLGIKKIVAPDPR